MKIIARKKYIAIVAVFVGAVLFIAYQIPLHKTSDVPAPLLYDVSRSTTNVSLPAGPMVRIGEVNIPVDVATTTAAIRKGLSGRASLEPDRGMLFIFPKSSIYQFWMPDMHFPIDIIWIENKKIVGIEKNVSPKFDPIHPRLYTPSEPVRHVLEVNAGFAEAHHLKIDDTVSLSGIE